MPLTSLFWRNLRVFWRNRAAVWFTVAAPVILTILFLIGALDPISDRILVNLGITAGGTTHGAGLAWVVATVAILSLFTTTVVFVAGFNEEHRTGRLATLQLAPVKRWHLSVAYLAAMAVVQLVVALVVIVVGQTVILISGNPGMSPLGWLAMLGSLILATLCFTGLAGLVASFIWSRVAYGGFAGLGMGIVGFLTFSFFVPHAVGPASLLGVLPFAMAGALIRRPMLTPVYDQYPGPGGTFDPLAGVGAGIQITEGGAWSPALTAVLLAVWVIVIVVCAVLRLNRTLSDR